MLKSIATLCALAFTCYQTLKLTHYIIRRKKIRQQTGMIDLELLGKARKDGKRVRGTAVICGGSVAGLAASRVCHDHFEEVIIVEPEGWLCTEDAWTENILNLQSKRSRLMQWESYQGTQVFTTFWFNKLFPRFEQECQASDICLVPGDPKLMVSGVRLKVPYQEYSGCLPKFLCCGRPGFETLLRRLVIGRNEYPNIKQIHGTVIGFESDPNNSTHLNKVLVRRGGDKYNETISIPAALVVDCTGLARAGTKMIRRLGFGTADEGQTKERGLDDLVMKYDQGIHYSTYSIPVTEEQLQRLPEEVRGVGVFGIYYPDSRKDNRVFLIQRSDRNIMHVCSGQWGDSELPTNLAEYETFARSLYTVNPVPESWYQTLDVLKEAEDKAILKNVRIPPSQYTPFHLAANMPSNWIAIGDSIMHINPVFGQGISKAFLGAATLNTLLHEVPNGDLPRDFGKKFFHLQADKIEPFWLSVKSVDYNFSTTEPLPGETLETDSGKRWYFRHVQMLATKDEHIASVVWHVRQFLAPPFDMLHPDVILKVVWEALRVRVAGHK